MLSTTGQSQARMLPCGDEPPRSRRKAPVNMVDFVSRRALVIACEWKRDRAFRVGGPASDNSKVSLGNSSLLEGDAEGRACVRATREDEKARRVAIEAMHGFDRAERFCESHSHGRRIEWCAGRHAWHPGRFVDDHDALVGKHDSWRCQGRSIRDRWSFDAHRSPSIDTQRQSRSAGGVSESMSLSRPTG